MTIPVPTLCRLEYLTANGWAVGHAGINLLQPARYVERLTARGKFARCTELHDDMTDGTVWVSPNLPTDFSVLIPDPPYQVPKVGTPCGICDETHEGPEGACLL